MCQLVTGSDISGSSKCDPPIPFLEGGGGAKHLSSKLCWGGGVAHFKTSNFCNGLGLGIALLVTVSVFVKLVSRPLLGLCNNYFKLIEKVTATT